MANSRATRTERRRPRAVLCCGLASFITVQLTLAIVMERRTPTWRDPEYGYKLARLQQRLVEKPDQPLTLVLGSSRAACGFRPDVLPESCGLTFNFAIAGAGPLLELLQLRRLLAQGIRPQRVVVEILPPLLHQEQPFAETSRLPLDRLGYIDVLTLRHYWPKPVSTCLRWALGRMLPCFTNRFSLLSCLAPRWLPWDLRQDRWHKLDRHGWLPYPYEVVTPEQYRRGLAHARREYSPCFTRFHITANADRTLRDLIELCQHHGIEVVLLTMPESGAFRGWYPSTALSRIAAYLEELSQTYQVPWIDSRTWLPDDRFCDGHHLLPSAAADFTRQFYQVLSASSQQ